MNAISKTLQFVGQLLAREKLTSIFIGPEWMAPVRRQRPRQRRRIIWSGRTWL
jgi:hypothetical protein